MANTKDICQGLQTKYNSEFAARKLFKELDQIKMTEAHWTFTSTAAMTLIIAVLFLLDLVIWNKYQQAVETPIPTPWAPPMPIPISTIGPMNKTTKLNVSIPISISISLGKNPQKEEGYWNNILKMKNILI